MPDKTPRPATTDDVGAAIAAAFDLVGTVEVDGALVPASCWTEDEVRTSNLHIEVDGVRFVVRVIREG